MRQVSTAVSIRWLSSLVVVGFAFQATGAELPANADPDVTVFASPTRLDKIGRVLIPVMVNGQGPFRFIVDTGASQSTISPRLVLALGVDSSAQRLMRVNGITGTADVPSVAIHRLQAGDLIIEEARIPVIWAPLMAGADGILGVAGLKKEFLLVDFRNNRVKITRSQGNRTALGFSRVDAKRLNDGLLTVAARIGGVRVQAVIDTGSERTIGNTALRNALNGWRRGASLQEVTRVYGATTEVAAGEMEVAPTIDLGTVRIGNVTIVYGNFHIFEVWGMQSTPALIIGMDVLGTVRGLGIDFQRAEIYFDGLPYLSSAALPGRGTGRPPGL